ncbi:MAG: hypothetical protein K8H88_00995, partial [Sandaracinaceae bacterium]|nr:hypothetical protein [Sandaracinaceae bacterium]
MKALTVSGLCALWLAACGSTPSAPHFLVLSYPSDGSSYTRAPASFSLLHVDCSYYGCAELGLAASQVQLVTWPEMGAVDATTGVGRFVSNYDRPTPPPDERYSLAAYWLEPAMPLSARWYAIRWSPPAPPSGEHWSPMGVPIAGGDYVFRFYGVSLPELSVVGTGPREGGGTLV